MTLCPIMNTRKFCADEIVKFAKNEKEMTKNFLEHKTYLHNLIRP